jgi:putative ubiquitin-RnfH superfamily antitoxin RatB of RatAB toxin-antitoxin module
VAVDGPQGPLLWDLVLDRKATIAVALAEARTQLEPGPQAGAIDWEAGVVGVWGVRCGRDVIPGDGDRIELYRPLPDDPRQRRRQRARSRAR